MEWALLILIVVLWAVAVAYQRTLHGQARALENFVRGVTLPLTDAALTAIPRRLFRASVGAVLGALPGLLLFTWMWAATGPLPGLSGSAILMLVTVAGAVLGVAIACTTNVGPSRPGAPRVARATRPLMSDYLSPAWVVASISSCLVGVAVVVVVILMLPDATVMTPREAVALSLGVACAATLALCLLLARRLLAAPQPANDSLDLAWDDALRAHGLRSVWIAPLAMGVATAFFAINLSYPQADGVFALEYLLCIAGVYALNRFTRPGPRFQRKLWPRTPQAA